MKFLPVWFAVCCVFFALYSGNHASVTFAQESAAPPNYELNKDPLKADGPLKKISDVQELFELKTVGTKLETAVVASYQEAQASVTQIRSKSGTGGGGSSSSGNGTWMCYFQGSDFLGHVSNGKVASHMIARFPKLLFAKDDSEFSILFQELKSPQRELAIRVSEDHVFDITLRSSELGYLFRFRQEKSGRIVCQEMSSEFVFARTAKSFDEFSKQNPNYVQSRLMKVFDFIGVGRPPTRFSSVVMNQVLLKLRPISDERMGLFKKAVEKMSASSFQDREAATAEIETKFEEWQDLIQIGMGDEEFATETRSRLTKIYGNHVDKETKQLMKLAQESKLHVDTEYLIWALGKTKGDADRKVFAKQLSKLTEQEFDLDTAKWISWYAENNKPEEAAVQKTPRNKVAEQTGPIDSATEFVQQLIKFTINEGELQLDREHWGKPFNEQPIEDSVAKIEEIMKQYKLPLEWLDAGGKFSLDSTEYPQIIFANMAAKLESDEKKANSQRLTYGYINQEDSVSRNRAVSTSKITAQMQFHKETGDARIRGFVLGRGKKKAPAAKYFYLYFKELTDAERILEIYESENKTISITLISDNTDTLIRMVQHPTSNADISTESRCVIYDIRGDQTQELKAANFSELFRKNADYLKNEWLPLMENLGIQIEIPNAESE